MLEVVTVRLATMDDAGDLLAWRADPQTVQFSRQHAAPSREEHLRWLEGYLSKADQILLIGLDSTGEAMGTVRFARVPIGSSPTCEVSIAVAGTHRGRGLGGPLLLAGERSGVKLLGMRSARAFVLEGNHPSIALFSRSGYRLVGRSTQPRGSWYAKDFDAVDDNA